MSATRLFDPIALGRIRLDHRVVMAPLTRFRCDEAHVPLPNMVEYYTQRSSAPGTLIIAEAVSISPRHCPVQHAPGIWTQAQRNAWRRITAAVHQRGCFIFCQLIAPGRAGALDGYPLHSSSPVAMEEGGPVPQEMTQVDILDCIADFKTAAQYAIEAGFDGVELHGANGYLIDQFTQDTCNRRSDRWGGSSANRSRFALEATKAVIEAVGSERTAVRLSPWSTFQGMKMDVATATDQFSHLIEGLKQLRLAYLHLVESRVINNVDCDKAEGLEFALDIWQNQSPVLVAGGYDGEKARQAVDHDYRNHDVLVVFGRYFVSTPDLVFRLRESIPPNPYDRTTFYTPVQDKGYIDYPFSAQFHQQTSVTS